jgi:hypothetical protein
MPQKLIVLLPIFLLATQVIQGEPSNEAEPDCAAEPQNAICRRRRFEQCVKERTTGAQALGHERCHQSCLHTLGPNAQNISACLEKHRIAAFLDKALAPECVESGGQPTPYFGSLYNASEVFQRKLNEKMIKDYGNLKVLKECVKQCEKPPKSPKGQKGQKKGQKGHQQKLEKVEKDASLKECFLLAYDKPFISSKNSRLVSEQCYAQSKLTKHAHIASLVKCLQRTSSPTNQCNHDTTSLPDQEQTKSVDEEIAV